MLSYKQKSLLTEILCLFILSVLIPFSNGMQIWSNYSFTFSLVLVTSLQLPVIVLFYRWFLPFTLDNKRYGLLLLLFPLYLVFYEINARLASIIGTHLPFIPQQYRNNLASAHPENFSSHYIIQNVGYTCLVLLSATSFYTIRKIYKNRYYLYLVENDKLKLELNQLKSQLQPHFFFNTLNNLYSLSTQGSPKTSAMIADLSGIMRYVLYDSQQERVSLKKEVDFIKSYIELERIRHDDAGIIDFDVQGDIDHIQIEPLLFLPIVENAFKHALGRDIPGKYVKIVLAVDEDEVMFQTVNPLAKGAGDLPQAGGIGLTNLVKRMELLYPDRHQLTIDHDDETFTVFLTIRFSNLK